MPTRDGLPRPLRHAVDQTIAAERLEGWRPTDQQVGDLVALLCDEVSFGGCLAACGERYPSDERQTRDRPQIFRRRRPYLIPGTTVLRNNFGVDSQAALSNLVFVASAGRQTDTIELLLMWSLRFVETFADDITNAFHEHLELWRYSAVVCDPKFPSPKRRSANDIRPELIDYLDHLRMTGGSLPGRLDSRGAMQIYWTHLVRLFKTREDVFRVDQHLRTLIEQSGLPISDQLPLTTPITATLGEKPWLAGPLRYNEARHMARRLRTACFVVIAYLSGMRTGLKRGNCV